MTEIGYTLLAMLTLQAGEVVDVLSDGEKLANFKEYFPVIISAVLLFIIYRMWTLSRADNKEMVKELIQTIKETKDAVEHLARSVEDRTEKLERDMEVRSDRLDRDIRELHVKIDNL